MSDVIEATAAGPPRRGPRAARRSTRCGCWCDIGWRCSGRCWSRSRVGLAVLAPWIVAHEPNRMDYKAVLSGPTAEHPLGTDDLGRDLLSRTLYGARLSLQVGLVAVLIAVALGVPLGLVSGYLGGILRRVGDAHRRRVDGPPGTGARTDHLRRARPRHLERDHGHSPSSPLRPTPGWCAARCCRSRRTTTFLPHSASARRRGWSSCAMSCPTCSAPSSCRRPSAWGSRSSSRRA